MATIRLDGKYLDKDGKLSDEKVELTLKDGGFVKGTDGKYTKTFTNVAAGKYTVTETNSDVDGYDLVKDQSTTEGEATVEDGKTATVELKDVYEEAPETTKLFITKTVDGDNITESEFEGALKFTVQNEDGKYLDKDGKLSDEKVELTLKDGGFVKGDDGKYTKTFTNVAAGKYTVTETNSDVDGYDLVKDQSTTEGEATVEDGKTATVELKDVYEEAPETTKLVITKTVDGDNITESEFEGALKFTVQNEDGKYLDKDGKLSDEKVELTLKDGGFVKVDDGKYTKIFTNVAAGKYTVTETNSDVDGYDLVKDQSTTEGEATVEDGKTATVELKDVYEETITVQFTVNKTDAGNGDEVEGAKLELIDKDGKVVDSWTSKKGETHDFGDKMKAGEEYTLRETVAPVGYGKVTTDITISVAEDGKITSELKTSKDKDGNEVYLVEDDAIHFNVNKTDLGNGDEIEGAKLEVFDKNGKLVDSWTSKKGETHDFGSKLEAGKEYVLRETTTPAGYKTVTDIEFTVNEDGSVKADIKPSKDDKGNEVYLVEDAPFEYYVNKTDASRYNMKVRNSNIAIYEVDKEGNETEVGRWLSDEGTNNRFNVGRFMMRGGRYIVREEVAPVGFGRVTVDVVLERTGDTPESVKVSVIDEDGKEIDISNGGTYEDAAGDKVSIADDGTVLIEDDHIHFRVNKVDAGNGKELDGAVLILYLADDNGVPMKEVDRWTSKAGEIHEFGDKMECGKTYVLRETTAPAGYEKITTDMIIKVSEEGVVSSELSESEDEDGNVVYLVENSLKKGASKDSGKSKGVKTGDETPIGEWLAVMAAAMSGLAATIYTRRRREDDVE